MDCGYKFRAYPTPAQEKQIQRTFDCVRFVYNYYLAKRKRLYEETRTVYDYLACVADLAELQTSLTWLMEVDAVALRQALRSLDQVYSGCLARAKQGVIIKHPDFKSKRCAKRSYKSAHLGKNFRIVGDYIHIPKLGFVECRVTRAVRGRISGVTIKQECSGKYYIAINCSDIEPKKLQPTGAVVGIDLGLKDYCITSDGVKVENPKYFCKAQKKLTKIRYELSRKTKDSKNYDKVMARKARCEEHIRNQRRDMLQKLTTQIVNENDIICLEDLRLQLMIKHNRLARSIRNAAWGEFIQDLEYKARWYGKQIVKVDHYYPSSQICSACGNRWRGAANLDVREWDCPVCGKHHDRDINAAINIMNEGLRILALK